ncbi:hypothetical protein UPYG_G00303210 [Umbra pygmaea]|uniref:C2H2-type domain-containing protein n=1 Tax=Umbra pygmaea TaxID=75934 RepID=A0ABD0WQE0_UMBPY
MRQALCESSLTLHRKLHSQHYTFPCRYLQPFSMHLVKRSNEKSHHFRDEENRYSCPDSALRFDNILIRCGHLKEHKSKIHICQVCYEEFSRGQLLERHVRPHSVVKPFECQVCQRCFALPNQLKVHLCVHTCYKSFNYNFHLKKHITRYHGLKKHITRYHGLKKHITCYHGLKKHITRYHGPDGARWRQGGGVDVVGGAGRLFSRCS